LFAAFDLPNGSARDTLADLIIAEGALILGSGEKSIRFRPHLNITREEIDLADEIIRRAIARL
jgi:L-lysine 6-transaminase